MFLQSNFYQYDPDVVATVMAQLLLRSALKLWGNDAQLAVEAEAKQLHWRNSFRPVHMKDLTVQQRMMILESHVFVEKK